MEDKPLSQDEIDHLLDGVEKTKDTSIQIDEQKDQLLPSDLTSQATEDLDIGKESQQDEYLGLGDKASDPRDYVPPGQVGVSEVNFPDIKSKTSSNSSSDPNLNLLMDVQMSLTVELGRTKMFVKEILTLGEGSIIELDKLAGEPVNLLVNGKLVAKGEVVVIDENFGVRVTDIVTPTERLKLEKEDKTI